MQDLLSVIFVHADIITPVGHGPLAAFFSFPFAERLAKATKNKNIQYIVIVHGQQSVYIIIQNLKTEEMAKAAHLKSGNLLLDFL